MNEPLHWWEGKRPPVRLAVLATLYEDGPVRSNGRAGSEMDERVNKKFPDSFAVSAVRNCLSGMAAAGMIKMSKPSKFKINRIELADWEPFRPAVMELIEKRPHYGNEVEVATYPQVVFSDALLDEARKQNLAMRRVLERVVQHSGSLGTIVDLLIEREMDA